MLRHTGPSSGITSTRPSSDVMQYTVRHLTRFTYDNPISESVMEVRMQPRTEQHQRCLGFELTTTPRATITAYRDPLNNIVHHFDIPGRHGQLTIVAEAIVEFVGTPNLPEALPIDAWDDVAALGRSHVHWDVLQHSVLARETPRLKAFAADAVERPPPRSAIGGAGDQRGDPPSLHLPSAGHRRRLADRRRARERRGRVPGLRPRDAGLRPPPRHPGALRQRLPVPRLGRQIGRRRHPRVDRSVPADARLGRLRSDQQRRRRHATHPRRHRPRLRRRAADQGRLPRPLGQRAGRRRPGIAGGHGHARRAS